MCDERLFERILTDPNPQLKEVIAVDIVLLVNNKSASGSRVGVASPRRGKMED